MTLDLISATLISLVFMCILPPMASEAMVADGDLHGGLQMTSEVI